jgi:hypothetical protein
VGSPDPDGPVDRSDGGTTEQAEDLRVVPRTVIEADAPEHAQLTAGVPINFRVHLNRVARLCCPGIPNKEILAQTKGSRAFLVRIGPTAGRTELVYPYRNATWE